MSVLADCPVCDDVSSVAHLIDVINCASSTGERRTLEFRNGVEAVVAMHDVLGAIVRPFFLRFVIRAALTGRMARDEYRSDEDYVGGVEYALDVLGTHR